MLVLPHGAIGDVAAPGNGLPPEAAARMMLPPPNGLHGGPARQPGTSFWYRGRHGGRSGWWWRSGPEWFFYGTAGNPFPDIYGPAGTHPGTWSWCDAARDFYPFVADCASGWRAVTPKHP